MGITIPILTTRRDITMNRREFLKASGLALAAAATAPGLVGNVLAGGARVTLKIG